MHELFPSYIIREKATNVPDFIWVKQTQKSRLNAIIFMGTLAVTTSDEKESSLTLDLFCFPIKQIDWKSPGALLRRHPSLALTI